MAAGAAEEGSDDAPSGALPTELRTWVERVASGRVVAADRHLAGASRSAWNVDVVTPDGARPLFLLRDPAGARVGGSGRDAAVLTALAPTAVPVPTVVGWDAELGALLLTRVLGTSDFPDLPDGPTAGDHEAAGVVRHLVELLATLHALDPDTLGLDGIERPAAGAGPADALLAGADQLATIVGARADVALEIALAWLHHHAPPAGDRTTLVHGDMGPGNFLHADGRVTAMIDWEIAHLGDPMEDLAALAVRDMGSARLGRLADRMAEYAAASGRPVDLARVRYFRTAILTRNALALTVGLAHATADSDLPQMAMYQALLTRAATQSLCEAVGAPLPVEPPPAEAEIPGPASGALGWAHAVLQAVVVPAVPDPFAATRAGQVADVLAEVRYAARVAAAITERERAALAALLGHEPTSVEAGHAALRSTLATAAESQFPALATYAAGRAQRGVAAMHPLMGAFADRWLHDLEDA